MYKLAAIAVALALFAVPAALAEHVEDESIVGAEGIYVAEDGLWSESNGFDGLQTEEFTTDHDADGEALDEELTVAEDDKILP